MTTTDFVTELLDANGRLLDEMIQAPADSPLHRGMSMVARNRVAVGLTRGLQSLTYGDDDNVDNVKEALRAAGEWLIRVADQGE